MVSIKHGPSSLSCDCVTGLYTNQARQQDLHGLEWSYLPHLTFGARLLLSTCLLLLISSICKLRREAQDIGVKNLWFVSSI